MGRLVGSKIVNETPGKRPGPRGQRRPNFGNPAHMNPFEASRRSSTASSSTAASHHANATDANAPLALEPALEVPGSTISRGLHLLSASAAGAEVAAVPHPAALPQPAGAVPHPHPEAPNTRKRLSSWGRFGDSVDGAVRAAALAGEPGALSTGPVMWKFIEQVRQQVNARITRKGHGIRQELSGKLDQVSPWFYPDEPCFSRVPDRDTHPMTPVFLVAWEIIGGIWPTCPNCNSDKQVNWYCIRIYKQTLYTVTIGTVRYRHYLKTS